MIHDYSDTGEVTADWLSRLGFEHHAGESSSMEKFKPPPFDHIGVQVSHLGRLWMVYGMAGTCLSDKPTRGEVLRLCDALGVEVADE